MAVFEALADRTRSRILELLADRERTAGELAAEFAITPPGVSRHPRILRAAGLVQAGEDGQRRLYALDAAALADLEAWLTRYRILPPDYPQVVRAVLQPRLTEQPRSTEEPSCPSPP